MTHNALCAKEMYVYTCVKCKGRIENGRPPAAYRAMTGHPISCCGEPMRLTFEPLQPKKED